MPSYTYKCKACSHTFDAHQSIHSEPLDACVKCDGSIYRLIGKGVGIQFIGSGFYINDSNVSPSQSSPSQSSPSQSSPSQSSSS